MNLTADWKIDITSTLYNSLSPDVLDVVNVGAKVTDATTQKAARIKKDANEVANLMELSSIADITAQSTTGLMDALTETALAGGSLGNTTTASITNALAAFQEKIGLQAQYPKYGNLFLTGLIPGYQLLTMLHLIFPFPLQQVPACLVS